MPREDVHQRGAPFGERTTGDVGERVIQPCGRVEAQVDVVAGDAIFPLPVERVVGGHPHVGSELTLHSDRRLIAVRIFRVRRCDRLAEGAPGTPRHEVDVAEGLLQILRFGQRAVPRVDRKVRTAVVERRQYTLRVRESNRMRDLVDELREVLACATANHRPAIQGVRESDSRDDVVGVERTVARQERRHRQVVREDVCFQVVPHTEIQRQRRGHLPVVLEPSAKDVPRAADVAAAELGAEFTRDR